MVMVFPPMDFSPWWADGWSIRDDAPEDVKKAWIKYNEEIDQTHTDLFGR